MVNNIYPKQGEIHMLNLSPTKGHEQKGYRPVLILSNDSFNKNTGFCYVIPITSKSREFPTRVEIKTKEVSGFALCDQIRCIDFKERKLKYVSKIDIETFIKIYSIIIASIELNWDIKTHEVNI